MPPSSEWEPSALRHTRSITHSSGATPSLAATDATSAAAGEAAGALAPTPAAYAPWTASGVAASAADTRIRMKKTFSAGGPVFGTLCTTASLTAYAGHGATPAGTTAGGSAASVGCPKYLTRIVPSTAFAAFRMSSESSVLTGPSTAPLVGPPLSLGFILR